MTPTLLKLWQRFTRPGKRVEDPNNYTLIQVIRKINEREERKNAETRTAR